MNVDSNLLQLKKYLLLIEFYSLKHETFCKATRLMTVYH